MNTNEERTAARTRCCFLGRALALAVAVSAPSACALRHEIFEPGPGEHDPASLSCTEVRTPIGQGQQLSTQHFRDTWSSALRTLSEEYSPTETYSGKPAFAWRYDTAGNPVAYVGFADKPGDTYANFQHDRTYDDRGNLTDLRLSYPSVPDVKTPSTADPWMGTTYQNEYTGSTLIASTTVPYGPGNSSATGSRRTFRENDLGQCDLIQSFAVNSDTPTTTETRTYDAAGRLETVKLVNANSGITWQCASSFTRHIYDGSGRIQEERTWCGADDSGDADIVILHQYAPDGSQTIERMDFTSDTSNDVIQTPNGPRSLEHSILTRTAGCAAIDAAIGAPDGPECRVEDPRPRH